MSDPRNDPRLRIAAWRALNEAYRRMQVHFGCTQCTVSSPRWCADRNHAYCKSKNHDHV